MLAGGVQTAEKPLLGWPGKFVQIFPLHCMEKPKQLFWSPQYTGLTLGQAGAILHVPTSTHSLPHIYNVSNAPVIISTFQMRKQRRQMNKNLPKAMHSERQGIAGM